MVITDINMVQVQVLVEYRIQHHSVNPGLPLVRIIFD